MENLSKEDLECFDHKNFNELKVSLYIIATPIGNYEDISLRAIKVLGLVDILLCEDTRKTKKLLSYFKIKYKKLISYNDKNAEKKRPYILKQLLIKKSVGVLSHAVPQFIFVPGFKFVH